MGKARASARVIDEWLRRVDAEYRSTAAASTMALWLVQIGASPDLVKEALRIARQELDHAMLSHRVYLAAGGQAGLSVDRAALTLPRSEGEPLEHDVARLCVDMFCLGETVAVRLFKELRQRCDVPVARRVLDRVLRDEVGHREFGWTLLEWLLALPVGPTLRALIVRELPASFERLAALYGADVNRTETTLPREVARWGLMPSSRYVELLEATHAKDYVPRFARLGIEVARAARLARTGPRG